MPKVTDIRSFTKEELEKLFISMELPAYRARQIYKWLWQKGARSFDEMTDLPKALREQLIAEFVLRPLTIHTTQKSKDGTIKIAFQLHEGFFVEGVLIPTDSRMTACVSSQVGCSLDCKFCATGYLKRERNLDASEIFDQVWILNQLAMENYSQGLNNIVYMGMGEPLLNYNNMWQSVALITGEDGLGMSPQRITVSTAGIAKMIKKMADDGAKFNLALSLHAATDEKRNAIMPINETNNLGLLSEAMAHWYEKTGSRPTLEYAVIEGVNDEAEEMEELAVFAKKFPCKINLIEYNPIALANFMPTDSGKLLRFAEGLGKHKLIVNVRRSRGKDIDAACGQLVNKNLSPS